MGIAASPGATINQAKQYGNTALLLNYMTKAIIVDDEQHCIDRLTSLLAEYCNDNVHLAGSFKTVEEGLAGIKKHQPDLVFLDVQLQDKTGFDLLKQVRNASFETIFTTAYDKYAVQAFKCSAIDYLLKPIDPDDLLLAIGKLEHKMSRAESGNRLEALFYNLKNGQGALRKIGVPNANGLVFLPVNEIIRCQSEKNYTHIFTTDHKKITVTKTLMHFEEMLADANFYRVHHSHLVNLAFIKSYHKNGHIVLTDEVEIEVSTRRKDDFLKRLSMM